eukprot:scaffold4815_cov19-Tisochrysis_lutea.AAC.4
MVYPGGGTRRLWRHRETLVKTALPLTGGYTKDGKPRQPRDHHLPLPSGLCERCAVLSRGAKRVLISQGCQLPV